MGFAAESNAIDIYAKEKPKEKNIDLIFANKIGSKDSGFESDNSEYQIFSRQENTELKKRTKKEAALELSCVFYLSGLFLSLNSFSIHKTSSKAASFLVLFFSSVFSCRLKI